MTPHASPAEVRAWVAAHLDPLEVGASEATAFRSDFDLNADWPVEGREALKPAAVLIGIVERPEGLSVILTRRADTLRQHTGQVALPGGRVDGDESPWACALREAQEEIGLDPALVELAGLSTTYRTGTGYSITPVVGFVTAGCVLTPNPDEVADIFETPFGFLMDPENHERRESRTPHWRPAPVLRHDVAGPHDLGRDRGYPARAVRSAVWCGYWLGNTCRASCSSWRRSWSTRCGARWRDERDVRWGRRRGPGSSRPERRWRCCRWSPRPWRRTGWIMGAMFPPRFGRTARCGRGISRTDD